MPTARHQQDLLQRLNESFRHGTPEIRKALSSNSLQKSPTVTDNKDGKKNDGNTGNNGPKKNNPRKNNNRNTERGSEGGNAPRDATAGNSGDSKLDRKNKRKIDIASTCSLHGLNAGHNDILCFDDHTTEENKKKIEANRADAKMKNHFRELDHAASKRKRTAN